MRRVKFSPQQRPTQDPDIDSGPERDAGFSLVEMVVTVSLMGIAMIPLMLAAWTLVKNTSFNRSSTKVATVLANAADRVNRAFGTCVGYDQFLDASVGTSGAKVTAEYYWFEPGATASAPGTWRAGICPGDSYDDAVVQRIDISVMSSDGNVRRSMQVVKSRI